MRTLLQGGQVLDGTGSQAFEANVLVEDGRIVDIAPGLAAEGALMLDATGKTVTPGFVDFHRHCDIAPLTRPDFGEIELAQGITTTAACNCGLAPVPCSDECRGEMYDFLEPIIGDIPTDMIFREYADYVAALKQAPLRLNMAFLAGAGAIKTTVKGFANTPYTPGETARAQAYVRQAMEQGALGVSLGIMYQPELYSTPEEISQVIKPAAQYDGVLTTHIRGEGDSLVESVEEVIHIAQAAGLRLNISHFKATGIHNWRDKILKAMDRIEAARAKGQPVSADFYPYDGGSSMMQSLLPPSVLGGSNNEMLRRLATAQGKAFLRQEIYKQHPGWDNMATSIGWERILVSSVTKPQHQAYGGKSISQVAQELGYADPADFVADLLVAEDGKVGVIVRSMSQEDVDHIARLPWTSLISDALYGGGGNPHPRLYGAFPKLIREYVLQRRVLTLPAAIHKMTGMPASRMGLADRGLLKPGYRADIAVFAPENLLDRATYTDPRQLSQGMDYVLVNGQVAWQGDKMARQPQGGLVQKGRS